MDKFDFIRIFFGIITFLLLVPGIYLLVERERWGSLIASVIVGAAFILLAIFGVCAAIFKNKGLVIWYIGIAILYEFFVIVAIVLVSVDAQYVWDTRFIPLIVVFVYLIISVSLAVEYRRDPLRLV